MNESIKAVKVLSEAIAESVDRKTTGLTRKVKNIQLTVDQMEESIDNISTSIDNNLASIKNINQYYVNNEKFQEHINEFGNFQYTTNVELSQLLEKVNNVWRSIGTLSLLKTQNKSSLVDAINEIYEVGGKEGNSHLTLIGEYPTVFSTVSVVYPEINGG